MVFFVINLLIIVIGIGKVILFDLQQQQQHTERYYLWF